MITVHHLNRSRSYRILWLLEELALPYEVVYYPREKSLLAPASLKQIHPLGKAPVITDGTLTLAESGAIIDYLVARYDSEHRFSPADALGEEGIRYRYWLHYAEGSLMPLLLLKLVFSLLGKAPTPWPVRFIGEAVHQGVARKYLTPQLTLHVQYIERHLAQHPWFAGQDFSAADIQMSVPLELLASRIDVTQYPALTRYLDNLRLRPAYQQALQREKSISH